MELSDSKAFTKVHSIILIAIVVVAAVAAYVLWAGPSQSSETIKIGVCADMDNYGGQSILHEVTLAIEHVNAEGGVLGRNLTVVYEDDDCESGVDASVASNALRKLIEIDGADFVIASGIAGVTPVYQEILPDYETILFDGYSLQDDYTQKVLDNYDRYKYYFRVGSANLTATSRSAAESVATCREYTGFNNVAILVHTMPGQSFTSSDLEDSLSKVGFNVVYTGLITYDTVDFSSYFAQAEAAGAEILFSFIVGPTSLTFVNEYYDRQSPTVLWGFISEAAQSYFWETTQGKCEHVAFLGSATTAGYPLTNKTLAFRDACLERWGHIGVGVFYNAVRFILTDAIKRAGTIETEEVIKALETTDVETTLTHHFIFTSSHDVMVKSVSSNELSEYAGMFMFQWQNGFQIPVYPKLLIEEAGASYTFPDWPGPWDNIN
jgi:branched-chain amino acid transport system substrate-binding protein